MIENRVLFGKYALLLLLLLLLMLVLWSCRTARADDACTTGCQNAQNTCMDEVAAHSGTPQGCLIAFKACKAECTPVPKSIPKVTDVGDSCAAAVCSASHLACYDHHCACEPGFVACGTRCVDVVNDENSCGACGVSCKKGQKCFAGECLTAKENPLTPKESKAGVRFDVTPGNCSEYESHPVLSANDGIIFQASGNSDVGQLVSWAEVGSPTKWKISNKVEAAQTTTEAKGMNFQPPACGPKGTPQNACPLVAGGDVWATTSGFTGREYVAARVSWDFCPLPFKDCKLPVTDPNNPPTHTSSPGIFSVLPSDLKSGHLPKARWALSISEADDGLTTAYDPGGSLLWVAATCGEPTHSSSGHPCAVLFPHCTGTVDTATCRRGQIGTGDADFADPMRDPPDNVRGNAGHTTVIVNPCTHHALVSFLESDSNNEGFVTVAAIKQGR
jgi:hypothetical protein